MRKVEVKGYSEQWSSLFAIELVDVHHIGSTAVPGLKAKPVIDIMPVVNDISHIDQFNTQMEELGYEAKGENGMTGRRFYQKGGDNRTHHVHIFQKGSDEITRHLAFRDYLRVHPDEMKRYGELKERLANKFCFDIDSYIKGKNAFVKELEEKALN